jgi:4-hydroxybenzoate polyprenyltransferase
MSFTDRLSPYLRLMRLHQPVGIWLLLWPCWWSLTLASGGAPSLMLMACFGLGAILMRSAGCIINDMADREFDRQVERTRTRPLASGELTMMQASLLMAVLLGLSACIAYYLGMIVVLWAALSLIPVVIYPFMKRISWWPQLFLGLTFNWGALMGWAAVRGQVEWPAVALYIGGIFWTLGYDTIYAHQDKEDDAKIGVKSTALRLGQYTKQAVSAFYLLAVLCWAAAGWMAGCSTGYFVFLLLTQLHLAWQVCAVNLDISTSCRRIFVSNTTMGWLMLMACLSGFFI